MKVAVVVPTYRRPLLLARCLVALTRQTFAADDYEIIVVDDGADTETERTVQEAAALASMRLRYLRVSGRHGPAAARNLGWRTTNADIIAFTDDDTIPAADWLAAGIAAFNDDVCGVWGRVVVPLPARPTDFERETGRLAHAEAVTANCFYRRTALADIGGFDERFTSAWREDSDVFFTLLERNGKVVYARDAVVAHPVRRAPWGVSVRLQRKSQFNALLYKKHPRLYRERIQRAPPWNYYAILTCLLLVIGGAAAGEASVAALAAFGWLAFTARFCVHRLHSTSRALEHVLEMLFTSVLIPPLSVFWRLRGAWKFRVLFI